MQISLLPCPFCGGDAEIITGSTVLWEHAVRCTKCRTAIKMMRGVSPSVARNSAINKWNTRKPVEQLVQQVQYELQLADVEKERCSTENRLQFDSVKGYATGVSNILDLIKNILCKKNLLNWD